MCECWGDSVPAAVGTGVRALGASSWSQTRDVGTPGLEPMMSLTYRVKVCVWGGGVYSLANSKMDQSSSRVPVFGMRYLVVRESVLVSGGGGEI